MLFIRAESLQNYAFLTFMFLVGNKSEQSKQDGVQRQIFPANYALIMHAYHCNRYWCLYMVQCHALRLFQPVLVKLGLNSLNAATRQVFILSLTIRLLSFYFEWLFLFF